MPYPRLEWLADLIILYRPAAPFSIFSICS